MSIATALQADEKKIRIVPTSFDTTPTQAQYLYMRPNIQNGGLIPAGGTLCYCPDIWPNNTTPISNYQTALATSDSYNTNPPSNVTENMTNYIYVRGYNGGATPANMNVTLYWSPSNMIQWPSEWQNNVIPTDTGTSNINNLPSGSVGVANGTFMWQPGDPGAGNHYCLIAQFNNAQNVNPFPPIDTQLDLSNLITNNLMWGWHNVNELQPSGNLQFSYPAGLTIPSNMQAAYYGVYVKPVGFTGWQVSFQCSQSDSNGNPIAMAVTNIVQDNVGLGINNIWLEPGYNATVTIYLYNQNNVTPAAGATCPISATYTTTTQAEFDLAIELGVIDWQLTRELSEKADQYDGMPIFGTVTLGAVTGQFGS